MIMHQAMENEGRDVYEDVRLVHVGFYINDMRKQYEDDYNDMVQG